MLFWSSGVRGSHGLSRQVLTVAFNSRVFACVIMLLEYIYISSVIVCFNMFAAVWILTSSRL